MPAPYLTSSTSWDKFTFLCLSCLICKVGTGPANIFLLLAVILQKCSSIVFSHLALTHFYVSLHIYKKSFSIFHLSFLEETHALKEITVSKTQFLKIKLKKKSSTAPEAASSAITQKQRPHSLNAGFPTAALFA